MKQPRIRIVAQAQLQAEQNSIIAIIRRFCRQNELLPESQLSKASKS